MKLWVSTHVSPSSASCQENYEELTRPARELQNMLPPHRPRRRIIRERKDRPTQLAQEDNLPIDASNPRTRVDMICYESRPDGRAAAANVSQVVHAMTIAYRFISPLCTDAWSLIAPDIVSRYTRSAWR